MKIFISYARPDEASARRLYSDLKEQNLTPWFDKQDLLPGQRWQDLILTTIRSSDFATVLFSAASIARDGFYQREIRTCLEVLQEKASGKIWLLPARLDECEVPTEIAAYHYVNLFPEWDEGIDRLVESISTQSKIKRQVEDQLTLIISEPTGPISVNIRDELIKMLQLGGAHRTRLGPGGGHEIWEARDSTGNLRPFILPAGRIGPSRGRSILRSAGLPPTL